MAWEAVCQTADFNATTGREVLTCTSSTVHRKRLPPGPSSTGRASATQGEASLTQPPEVPIDAGEILAAARRFGLPGKSLAKAPSTGIINTIYMLDARYVVRVPRDHVGHFMQTRREASVLPSLVESGVGTPRLVAFDDSCTTIPVPFTIVERAEGIDAETASLFPPDPEATWRQFGRELARTHATSPPPAVASDTNAAESVDLVGLLERRATEGWISSIEMRRLHQWVASLSAHVEPPSSNVLVHGDAQMSNVLVDPSSGAFNALIDWGCAHMGSRAVDFRVVPLAAVAPMLDGYSEVTTWAGLSLEAEILLARFRLLFNVMPFGPAPGSTWGERSIAWLTDLLLTLATTASPRWTELRPPLGPNG